VDLEGPPPPHLRCRRRSKVGWGGGDPRSGRRSKVGWQGGPCQGDLGREGRPPPPCAHTRTTFQTAWQSLQAASLTKKLRTVELSIRPESRRRQMPRHRRCGPNLTLAYQKLLSLMNSITGVDQPAGRRAPVVMGPMVPPKSRRRQTPRYRRCGPLSLCL
jgi:hypothetical protein